jgi:hypothetical protein
MGCGHQHHAHCALLVADTDYWWGHDRRHVSVARPTMSLRSAVASKVASADAAITAAQPEPTQSSTEAGKEDIKGMQGAMLEPSAANKSWVGVLLPLGLTACS